MFSSNDSIIPDIWKEVGGIPVGPTGMEEQTFFLPILFSLV